MSSNSSSDNTKMSAAVKSTKKSAATKNEPVAAAPVAAAPAATASKASAKKSNDKPAAAAAPAVTPAVAAPVAATTTETHEEDISATLQKSIADLQEQLSNLKTAASAASNALKTIEKQAARVIKKADRRKKRKVDTEGGEAKASSCIFTKPVKITEELCSFLGKPKGTEVSRSAVTKGVLAYAKSHNLMDKQAIKADAALRKLLTLNEGQELTILNLQKFLRRHYVKAAPVAA
jgi:hypothetical protein